jgi:Family of unknown function (DUF6512)
MAKRIWWFELAGIPFIVIAGSMLHFVFAWSGHWIPVALFAAVNESVWEHLKLAFWPGLAWAAFECATLRPKAWQFWSAKGIGLLIAPVLIICIFYLYTALLGRNILVLDIATFVVAIALGQAGSAILINNYGWRTGTISVGISLLVCQLIAYCTLTYYPPPFSIFEDSRDRIRGIPTVVKVPR